MKASNLRLKEEGDSEKERGVGVRRKEVSVAPFGQLVKCQMSNSLVFPF